MNVVDIKVDLLEKNTPQAIELKSGLCHFGNIPIETAYKKTEIDRLIRKIYSSVIHISKEGTGMLIDAWFP